MSSTEEIITAPNSNANGLEKSPTNAHSSPSAQPTPEKMEMKNSTMTDGESSQSKNVEEKSSPAVANHDSLSTDVEMKVDKEKTPEPDNQSLDKKDKPTPDEKKASPADDKIKSKKEKTPVKEDNGVKDTSGEEKFTCVITAPLTDEKTPEKETATEGEKEETEEVGEDDEEKEHEEEEQEKGSSPRKRAKRASFSPRKRSQKKSPKKKAEKVTKEAEKSPAKPSKDAEKSPEKPSKDDNKEPSASAETPKKPSASPRKRQRTPDDVPKTPEQEEKSADTSPKSSKSTPLLEAPLVIEGKRSRQRVERLDTQMLTPTVKTVDVPHGKGVKLGEISYIDVMISKTQTNDLKGLHKLAFGRPGTPTEIRKNLRSFCGFSEDAKEYEKKKKSLDNHQAKDLKKMCEVLGLEGASKKTKDELVELVLEFLNEPKDMGKKTPQPKSATKRKRQTTSSSRKRSSTSAKKASTAKKSADASGDSAEEEEEGGAAGEPEAEQEPEEKKEAENEDDDEPKSKKTKKGRASTSSAAAAATPSPSRGQPKRAAKNAKKPAYPSDAEIKTTIKDLLKGMNLEEVTMKEMTKKVYDRYPQVDISSKKDFIKETVKTLLSATE